MTPVNPKSILLLHHQPELLEHYEKLLEATGANIVTLRNGADAVSHIYESTPNMVVADTMLPEINGYQICRLIKHDPFLRKIPVLLIASSADAAEHPEEKVDQFWGFKAGADDFLQQTEIDEKLLQRVQTFLDIYEQKESSASALDSSLGSGQSLSNIRTRLTQILDKSLIEKTLMVEFRNLSDLIHDKSLLAYMVFSLLESLIDYDLCALFFNDKSRDPRIVTFQIPPHQSISTQTLKTLKTEFFSGMNKPEAISRQYDILEFSTVGAIQEDAPDNPFHTRYYQEFFVEDELIGAFAFYSSKPKMDYQSIFPVALVEDELKLLMKLRYLYSQAEMLAITDGLTGLFNYRHFTLTLDREFRRAQRYNLNFSLALIDIDHFKDFNDKWGHLIGDEVLKNIADVATHCFRTVDFVARYGGEEIAVIFPETTMDMALKACERFREAVEKTPVTWENQKLVSTVSIGLASISPNMDISSDLLREADQRLYEAKRQGRNRVINV